MDNDKIVEFYIKHNATLEEIDEVRKYLDNMEKAEIELSYLEAFGVDNWYGYSEAIQAYYEDCEEDE